MAYVAESKPAASPKRATSRSPAASPRRSAAMSAGASASAMSAAAMASSPPSMSSLLLGSSGAPGVLPAAASCSYAPCYCEENVWKLCDHVRASAGSAELAKAFVVFVSNKKQVVPLWRQKAGKDEEKLVIWDYHVLFLYRPDDRRCLVYDLDSDLPFPTYFHKYVTETFRTDAILNAEYHRHFRVVPAALFLAKFASDRRHMRKADGTWMKPPPPYPCIQNGDSAHNLDDFICMDPNSGFGEVLSLKDFVQRFYRN